MTAHIAENHGSTQASQRQKLLRWIVLAALAALVGAVAFRGYLNPELLFHFGSGIYC